MLGAVLAGEMELDGDVLVGLGNEVGEEWGGSETGGEDLHGWHDSGSSMAQGSASDRHESVYKPL